MIKYTGPIFKAALDGAPGYILLCKEVPPAYWAEHDSAWKLGPVEDLEYYIVNFKDIGPPSSYTSGAGYRPETRIFGRPDDYAEKMLFWIPAEYVMPELNEYGLVSL